jgi:uncharacterized phage protein (TIGR01671 family)
MREIKFRIWNHETHTFYDSSRIKLSADFKSIGMYVPSVKDYVFSDTASWNVTIQQYTGLKDINDKEICEGDILSNGKEHDLCERYSMKSLYVVDYANGTYKDPLFYKSLNDGQFFKSEFPSDRAKNCDYSEMTIIGNILENRPLIDK